MYGPLDEAAAAYVLKELLRALRYLHSERKIHRDVKAGNLLLAADATVHVVRPALCLCAAHSHLEARKRRVLPDCVASLACRSSCRCGSGTSA